MTAYEGSKMQEQRQDHFGTPVDHHGYTIKQDYQGIGTDSYKVKTAADVVEGLLKSASADVLAMLYGGIPAELERRFASATAEVERVRALVQKVSRNDDR